MNSIQKNDFNPKFGMSLFMNEAKIGQKLGKRTQTALESIRPRLEDLVKDANGNDRFDLFVYGKLDYDGDVSSDKVYFRFQNATPKPKHSKNPIVNFFREMNYDSALKSSRHSEDFCFVNRHVSPSKELLQTAEDAKAAFKRSF